MHRLPIFSLRTAVLLASAATLTAGLSLPAQEVDKRVLDAEQKRITAIEKVRPAVVAMFAKGSKNGGSGVLISKDGFALTNFHVVQATGPVFKCGLPDGLLYDAVVVGLDKVGDVALVQLQPKEAGKPFPFAALGDSDKVQAGNWSLAMGNPFLLATDFTPTVTFGLVSGVHRYQEPAANSLLEYTDCIQIDTSINPGNSGGPLFNLDGELIGINGRGSFDKRGRINSGVGYAISINQIKNFLPALHAGLDTDHATLGAAIETDKGEDFISRLLVRTILDKEQCDARRRGLDLGDELIEFAGRPMTSVNQFQNVMGIYPKGWRLPMTYRHNNDKREVLVRLMGYLPRVFDDNGKPVQPDDPKKPKIKINPQQPDGPAAKLYEPKPGFANWHFNKIERDRLLTGFKKHGDFSKLTGEWVVEGFADLPRKKGAPFKLTIREEKIEDGKGDKTMVYLNLDTIDYRLEPLKRNQVVTELKQPNGSGGFMLALHHYRQLLAKGEKGFVGQYAHAGREPLYPPRLDGKQPKSLRELRVDAEVLATEEADVNGKWYFAPKDQSLIACEIWPEQGDDPCEIYFSDYRTVDGRELPHRFEVRYGDERYGTFTVKEYKLK